MQGIDMKRFEAAVRKTYPQMSPEVAAAYAGLWAPRIDSRLHEALNRWMDGLPIGDADVTCGEFSIRRILAIRADEDCLQAILLLSAYMRDPAEGLARILEPRR